MRKKCTDLCVKYLPICSPDGFFDSLSFMPQSVYKRSIGVLYTSYNFCKFFFIFDMKYKYRSTNRCKNQIKSNVQIDAKIECFLFKLQKKTQKIFCLLQIKSDILSNSGGVLD